MRRLLTSVLLLSTFIGAVVWLRGHFAEQLDLSRLAQILHQSGSTGWAVLAFCLLYLLGTTALVPAAAFHAVAGAVWGFWPGVGLSLALANLTSNLQFAGGRRLGQQRVERLWARRGWGAVAREAKAQGVWAMVIVRQMPLPFVVVNVAAGASPLAFWQFALGSGLGLVPSVLVYTWCAAHIIEGLEEAQAVAFPRALAVGAVVMISSLLGALLVRRRERRRTIHGSAASAGEGAPPPRSGSSAGQGGAEAEDTTPT